MNTLNERFTPRQFVTAISRAALVALAIVTLMASCAGTASAREKLHPGDISGSTAPVTVVCKDPQAMIEILMQQTLEATGAMGKKMASAGRCMALPGVVVVHLARAVGFVIIPPEVTSGPPLRATVYQVLRKDGDMDNPNQYYVYALEPLQES